jgi:GNAT superfamily N-acetyltransferase
MAAWSRATLLRALFEAPRVGFEPLPDSVVVEREGWWQLTTPSFRDGGFNEVALSALGEDEADAVIDETLAHYAELGLSFRWTVGPESAPADLGARLSARGLVAQQVSGMTAALSSLVLAAPPPSVRVEPVSLASEPVFTRVMAEGWQVDEGPLASYHRLVLTTPGSRTRLFLASVGGKPAGTASYVALDEVAFLIGAVVLPRFRGRGVYQALVRARLHDAATRAIPLAASHAGAMSSPILARLGFTTVCKFAMYTPP